MTALISPRTRFLLGMFASIILFFLVIVTPVPADAPLHPQITLFRELPTGIGFNQTLDITLVIDAGQDLDGLTLREAVPSYFTVIDTPPNTTFTNSVLEQQIPHLAGGQTYTFTYTVRSPQAIGSFIFNATLATQDEEDTISTRIDIIQVSDTQGYFDVQLNASLYGIPADKDLLPSLPYLITAEVRNTGLNVTEYPVYLRIPIQQGYSLKPVDDRCYLQEDQGTSYLVCAWSEFLEQEDRTARFQAVFSHPSTLLLPVEVTYDPPAIGQSLLSRVLGWIKTFFTGLFSSSDTPTGDVVQEPLATNIGTEEDTLPLPEGNTETPGLAADLADIPGYVEGKILLDASGSTYDPNDDTTFTFLVSDDLRFSQPLVVCSGSEYTCLWDTWSTSDYCTTCYLRVELDRGLEQAASNIQLARVDSTAPRILSLTPEGGSIETGSSFRVQCTAQDVNPLNYLIYYRDDATWRRLCEADICTFDWSLTSAGSIDLRCVVEDALHVAERTEHGIRRSELPSSGSGHTTSTLEGTVQEKIWYSTNKTFLVVVHPPSRPAFEAWGAGRQTLAVNATTLSKGKDAQDLLLEFPDLASSINLKHILLKGVQSQPDQSPFLSVDALTPQDLGPQFGFKKGLSIDPTSLDFETGTITLTASGSQLWKCKDWDFAQQSCQGTWTFVQSLVPGQDYVIELSPDDPAYAEVGVATINTDKPIYHPGETSTISITVLDRNGYLADPASLQLIITDPLNQSIALSPEQHNIVWVQRGIYRAVFNQTLEEGNYFLLVTAVGEGVNQTMASIFQVLANYPYDIIRQAPLVIDPWRGPFSSGITVLPLNASGVYTLTEHLPGDLTVLDTGNASSVQQTNKTIQLTWENLSGNTTVNYLVQAPLVSPSLLALGPAVVIASDHHFSEGRNWFIAVDPSFVEILPDGIETCIDTGSASTCLVSEVNQSDDVYASDPYLRARKNGGDAILATRHYKSDAIPAGASISSVDLVVEWRISDTTGMTCEVGVWDNTTAAYTRVTTSCPPTTEGFSTFDLYALGIDNEQDAENAKINMTFAKSGNGVPEITIDLVLINVTFTTDPAPQWSSPQKNETTVFQYSMVHFNTTWTDNIALSGYIFSTNASGGWQNSTFTGFSGTSNVSVNVTNITASPGASVGWRFFANDSYNGWNATTIQTFSVASASDSTPPAVSNEAISPTNDVTGSLFNITATVTDNVGVASVDAEIQYPNGSRFNYSMGPGSGDTYYYTFTGHAGGEYVVTVFATDGSSNIGVSSTSPSFNVTSNASLDRYYYDRPDTILINLSGFTADTDVAIDLFNDSGVSIGYGFPVYRHVNGSGTNQTYISIPGDLTLNTGNLTIVIRDNQSSTLDINRSIRIIHKPNIATKTDSGGSGVNQLFQVNYSDGTVSRIDASNGEDYIDLTFSNNVPTVGYEIGEAILTVQHYQEQTPGAVVQWYNASSLAYETVCTLTQVGTSTFQSCNLTSRIDTLAKANNLKLRLTDNDQQNNNYWEDLDFAFLDLKIRIGTALSVQINEPALVYGYYTFENDTTNNKAYDGPSAAASPPPAGAPFLGTEATSAEYTNLSSQDDQRFYTLVTGQDGERAYQSFKFTTTETVNDITELRIVHEGNATLGTTPTKDDFEIHLYNFTLGGYQEIQAITGSGSEVTTVITLTDGIADFINTSGEVWVLVEGQHTTSGGPGAQAQLFTDYMELRVATIPLLSGDQLINATAVDNVDGVAACNYSFINSSGIQLGPFGLLNSSAMYYWTNVSDTNLVDDGLYTVVVNCTDTTGETAQDTVDVRVSNAPPQVVLLSPAHLSNFTTNVLNFSWNASSSSPGNLVCDVYLDGSENISNVVSVNGANTTREIAGLSDGQHEWYVNCSKGGKSNASQPNTFDIDTLPPQIQLHQPNPGIWSGNQTMHFNYTPSDAHTIASCSLVLDGGVDQINTTISNTAVNNFTVLAIPEGFHTWRINCTDVFNHENSSDERNFTIDVTAPTIYLNTSNDSIFGGGQAILNFTAYDNLATTFWCNLSVNSSVVDPDIPVTNGTTISRTILKSDGDFDWNVTCWDQANITGYSNTNNFSITGPPVVTLLEPPNMTWDKGVFVNFTFFAEDGNGLNNCTLIFDSLPNQTLNSSQLNNGGNNTFNLSNIPEGFHTWNVNCSDTTFDSRLGIADFNLTIDRTDPLVSISGPDPETINGDGNLSFNFTVTDNLDEYLFCNLSISGHSINATNLDFNALNDSLTTLNETGIPDGIHYWNVTCIDNASNWNTSQTWNFTVNGAPVITLLDPQNNNVTNGTLINLTYNVTDINGVANCTLYWDGQPNSTIYTADISLVTSNNFTLYDVPQDLHTWAIGCFDQTDRGITSAARNITVDTVAPLVLAYSPNDTTLQSNDVMFNFSVVDDVAESLLCVVNVSGGYNYTITAANASNVSVNITGIGDGYHDWNVSCYDNASNSDVSEMLNFTIDAAPQVIMDDPINDTVDTDGDLVFYYRVFESNLVNCSLYFNNSWNMTEGAANVTTGGTTNNFTLSNVSEGLYPWEVVCEDINGFTGTDMEAPFYIHVDFTPPEVNLSYPPNEEMVYASTINFNFTANDTVDNVLLCNLTINDTVNQTGINATAGNDTIVQVSGFEQGNYTWNVTCTDGAFTNWSQTWSFFVNMTPKVTLQSPYNTSHDGDGNLTLFYLPESGIGFNTGYCQLFFDGASNQTEAGINVQNGLLNNFTVDNLDEGEHNWSVTCQDNNGETASDGPWYVTVDLTAPNVTIHDPNGTLFFTSDVLFNWTAEDNYDDILVCNLTVNGSVVGPDLDAFNGNATLATIGGFADGLFFWNVSCLDNATHSNTSLTYNFTVEEPPAVSLGGPADQSRTNQVDIDLFYTPTDNSGEIANCSLYVNDTFIKDNESAVQSGTEQNFSMIGLPDGNYTWNVSCIDPSGNQAGNDSAKTFYIDLTGPWINLTSPNESQTFNGNDITLNWTAQDFPATLVMCNLTFDGLPNVSSLSKISPGSFNYTLFNLTEGPHNWTVTCWDDLNNSRVSELRNFTVNQPDLLLSAGNITFNNTNPDENETILINATVANIGGNDAADVFVGFWDGDPLLGGIPIGNDTITVEAGNYGHANISWNITPGLHTIFVAVDPDNLIGELDETNNNASRNISMLRTVISWPGDDLLINQSVVEFNFTVQNFTGGQLNYTVYVDGLANGQTDNLTDNTSTLLNITFTEGTHVVSIEGWDGLDRARNATITNLTIDLNPPNVTYHTENGTWFATPDPSVNFSLTDTIDQLINFTLYLNGSVQDFGALLNATPYLENFTGLENGTWIITLDLLDDANNTRNTTPFTFYVDTVAPTVNLTYPGNLSVQNQSWTDLNFTADDNMADYLLCNLTYDGSVIRQDINMTPGNEINTSLFAAEGNHTWDVACMDRAGNSAGSGQASFIVSLPPNLTLVQPANETWSSNTTQLFTYNVSDDTGIQNCSLWINGQINQTNDTVVNNATNNFTVAGLNNTIIWSIACFDNTTQYNSIQSENRTLYIDTQPPTIEMTTQNLSYFQDLTPEIFFNTSDNMDQVLNITAYADSLPLLNTSASNSTPVSLNLTTLSEGAHTIILESLDEANNSANSTSIIIYIDITEPNITLYNPLPNESMDSINVTFNFSVVDNFNLVLACNLSVSGVGLLPMNATNSTFTLINLTSLPFGLHYWNVTCIDNASNWNTSETRNFTIPAPDLSIAAENITFSQASPVEGTNISIDAEVFNLGLSDAEDVIVQFWDGDPDVNGTQINGNFTANFSSGQNLTFSVNYTVHIGSNLIYVVVDPPTATNGTIPEEDETNNKAWKELYVGEYHTFIGNTTDVLRIDDANYTSLFTWDLDNATGGHILVADTDSNIQFNQLRALSRNTTDAYRFNDFTDLDGVLGIPNASTESINTTWTSNDLPYDIRNLTLYSRTIEDVPIVNSTNNTNFFTGILWDQSDGPPEFNGTQDVVMVAEINEDREGFIGIEDFEIKVPARLRSYIPGTDTVSFYIELP